MKPLLTFIFFLTTCFILAQKPNIILILADDMGYSDIAPYGSEINTPNISSIAENGIKYLSFYNAGRCSPTRASLLTGLYPQKVGVGRLTKDEKVNPGYRGFLNPNSVTIAEALKDNGYSTFITGKWHIGHSKNEYRPLAKGFDHFYGFPEKGGVYFKMDTRTTLWKDDVVVANKLETPKTENGDVWYSTDALTSQGLDWVDESLDKNTPFFWYLSYNAPHFPLRAKKKDIEKYRGKYKNGWDELRKERFEKMKELGVIPNNTKLSHRFEKIPDWDSLTEEEKDVQDLRMATYAAMIDCMDQNIGRIITKLKEKREYENTIIVFLSDNGGCGEGGTLGSIKNNIEKYGECWANASNTPYRLFKKSSHEGGIRTPLLIQWPNTIPKGEIRNIQGHVIDILPTLLAASNTSYIETKNEIKTIPYQGISLLDSFSTDIEQTNRAIYFEHEGNKSIIKGNWKLAKTFDNDWELYNVKNDPTELNNLISKYPEKHKYLEALWNNWAIENNVNRLKGFDRKGRKKLK